MLFREHVFRAPPHVQITFQNREVKRRVLKVEDLSFKEGGRVERKVRIAIQNSRLLNRTGENKRTFTLFKLNVSGNNVLQYSACRHTSLGMVGWTTLL